MHPKMTRDEVEARHSFGSSAQRILSVLLAFPDGVDSIETLQGLTHLSDKTTRTKTDYLEYHGIVETAKEGTRAPGEACQVLA